MGSKRARKRARKPVARKSARKADAALRNAQDAAVELHKRLSTALRDLVTARYALKAAEARHFDEVQWMQQQIRMANDRCFAYVAPAELFLKQRNAVARVAVENGVPQALLTEAMGADPEEEFFPLPPDPTNGQGPYRATWNVETSQSKDGELRVKFGSDEFVWVAPPMKLAVAS